jgi:hypothetical protein
MPTIVSLCFGHAAAACASMSAWSPELRAAHAVAEMLRKASTRVFARSMTRVLKSSAAPAEPPAL